MSNVYQEYPDDDKGVIEIYNNIDGIHEKFFPNDIEELVDAVVKEFTNEGVYNSSKSQWSVWPDNQAVNNVECVKNIIDNILRLVQEVDPPPRGKLLFCGSSSSPEIMVPIIIEDNNRDDYKVWKKLSHVVRFVFNTQDSRRYVQALTVCGTRWRLWIYDRSGAFSSKSFDINLQWNTFVQIIIGYYMMSDSELGFDSTIFYDEESRMRNVKLPKPGDPV